MKDSMKQIQQIVESECNVARQQGLLDGLQAAEHIWILWSTNHKLISPHSQEQLEEWTKRALDELKEKIGKLTVQ